MLFPPPLTKKNISSLSFRCSTRCLKTLPPAIPVYAWPRFHVHLDNSELWCPAGCCKELRARRQGCLEWRVGSRHVRAARSLCGGREHRGLTARPREECHSGYAQEIRTRCAVHFGAESGPCALLCTAAKRSMDAPWRAEARQSSLRLGSQETSAWLTVDRNVRAPCRAEYVKSKGLVNVWRGRKTSDVAGEAKLRKPDRLCRRCHNFFQSFRFRSDSKNPTFSPKRKEGKVYSFMSFHQIIKSVFRVQRISQ
ncbi:hypothetical protein EI94DRAFT_172479 [Lactarius quietus]|nr:hypothetical protein EI94DRAFT_172479 [Lactarius quietus]